MAKSSTEVPEAGAQLSLPGTPPTPLQIVPRARQRLTIEASRALGGLDALVHFAHEEQDAEILRRAIEAFTPLVRLIDETATWLKLSPGPQEIVDELVERYGEAGAL